MSKPTTIDEILLALVSNVSSIRAGKTFNPTDYTGPAKQELLELLESKAETLSTVEEKEPLLYGFVPVRAIPLTALRELEGK
jgi:hypothetical protein